MAKKPKNKSRKSQPVELIQGTLEPLVFREETFNDKQVDLSSVETTADYLVDKLKDAPPIVQGHDELLKKGVNLAIGVGLMERVLKEWGDHPSGGAPQYSNKIKQEVADYASMAMQYLLKIESADGKRIEKFERQYEAQLKPENRPALQCSIQIVDATLALAARMGVINRRDIGAWGKLSDEYKAKLPSPAPDQGYLAVHVAPADKIFKEAYLDLVTIKEELRAAYGRFHAEVSKPTGR